MSDGGRPELKGGGAGDPRYRPMLWWAGLAMLAIAAGSLLPSLTRRTPTISYSEFRGHLEQDNIARVEILPEERLVRGEFRTPVREGGRTNARFRTTLPFPDPAPIIAQLEAHGVPVEGVSGGGGGLTFLFSLLPWLLLIGVWVLLIRGMQGGVRSATAFGRIGARPLSPDRPKVTFADVAGAVEAKADLQQIIEFLKEPMRFQRLGSRMPKGVLLVGPPGTGKTLLARAVAGEAEVPFFSISGSDFVEMFVGVGAARVRDLFEAGKARAPCIIFIDELDAVGRLRGAGLGGGHDEREQTLNQLLVELDGFEPNEGVVLLSATNRPDVLDPALLRPGRFDRRIVVDLPDVRGREQILSLHAGKVPLGDDVDLATVARGTPGMSGADLANLVNEASLLAARREKERVDMREFEDAKDTVMLGGERRSLVLSERERRVAAYHEAGHALLALLIPGQDPVHKVTIVPRGRALGLTFSLPEEDRHTYSRSHLEGRLVVSYGGRVAEELVLGYNQVTTGAAQDFNEATILARRMVTEFGMSDVMGPVGFGNGAGEVFLGRELVRHREFSDGTAQLIDQEVQQLLSDAHDKATRILSGQREPLHRIAAALLSRETLTGEEIDALVYPELRQGAVDGLVMGADSASGSMSPPGAR